MLVQAQVVPWWGTGRRAEFHPVTGIAYRQEDRRVRLQNRVVSTTARRALHTLSRNEEIRIFLVPPPLGVGVFGKLPAARKRKDRQRNRLGRSQQAPACPRNRKPAGDLARQIEPLPSRSGRHLDYESSGSPSPSRSYRRPGTESQIDRKSTRLNSSHRCI